MLRDMEPAAEQTGRHRLQYSGGSALVAKLSQGVLLPVMSAFSSVNLRDTVGEEESNGDQGRAGARTALGEREGGLGVAGLAPFRAARQLPRPSIQPHIVP